jgi:hypothetical protein
MPTLGDIPSPSLYTYNQGIILSALRDLYHATGNKTYLSDGHDLVHAVIAATGWDIKSQQPFHDQSATPPVKLTSPIFPFGTDGILEETCDRTGKCNQDAQAFKGVFFSHLKHFCSSTSSDERYRDDNNHHQEDDNNIKEILRSHRRMCHEYTPWVRRNAHAALRTRDDEGRFGGWWAAAATTAETEERIGGSHGGDRNDRGRGRTLETQGSGVAVLAAWWEFEGLECEG